ncbi:HAMP domain-containing protein [Streptomyces turgidiscabies]|uniref:histidine kinase n=1 Tax=Streptomyces turgidiscabies (strain Car8) TaxID=698760 RepID=L7FHG7_STRT8|nr:MULTISPECIES: HAMP domain-containing protein [Streptomyces]ELP70135.1 HAMP domain protein [Streptomyces turgidiscabies Car8]MDX3496689.1 HAMP domain-containing protein [Streptomyces turgidiscabies]GAQ72893.1 sensor protein BasS [Streptomyces turgidiscabies]
MRCGVVRASSPASAVRDRILLAWAVLAWVCALALKVAVLVARRQARVSAAPLEDLSRHSLAVPDGDLSARAGPSDVAEIDQVARTHNEMLHSLTELLRHERDFTANASHRLHTPLTGLQLTLEAGPAEDDDAGPRPVIEETPATIRRLYDTVEEVREARQSSRHTASRYRCGRDGHEYRECSGSGLRCRAKDSRTINSFQL